jgi:type I restriction enzyme, S subunit
MKVKSVPLAEIAMINPAIMRNSVTDDELVAFVPMASVTANPPRVEISEILSFSSVKTGFTYFQDGDILVAKITPCFENGKIAQARIPQKHGFGSTEFHVVRPIDNQSDARYILHFLRQSHIRIDGERNMTGSAGQRRVPKHFLAALKIPLPPIATQKKIAAILDQAEALRSLRRQSIEQLDALARSVFLEMFGDPVTNPKEWGKTDLGLVGSAQGGLQVSASRSKLPCKAPYLRVANVYRDALDLSEIKTISATEAEIKRTLLEPDDLLIVEGHGNPNEIGRCALWDGSIENCIHQNHLIRFRVDLGRVHPLFICRYLNSEGGRRDLLRAGKTTSGLNTISVSNVRAVKLLLPPLALQQEFADRIQAIETLKTHHRQSLATMDRLFNSLQHRAFRGEL